MRRLPLSIRCAARGVGVVLSLTGLAAPTLAQRATNAPSSLARAKAALDSGEFAAAEALYDRTIATARDSSTKGDAYFGRAYAAQRRLMADRDSLDGADARKIAGDYRRAGVLRPSIALGAAANGSSVLQAAGLASVADSLWSVTSLRGSGPPIRQERGNGDGSRPEDAPALLRLGNLFAKRGMSSSARSYFTRAYRADTTSVDALRAVLKASVRDQDANAVLTLSTSTLKRPAAAAVVEDALLDFLETPAAGAGTADSSLVLCARAWAVMGLGPASFAVSEESRLRGILQLNPATGPIIQPMLDAYRPRTDTDPFRDTSPWWRKNDWRRAAWSQMLRSLGDSYNGSGRPLVAESFYEAAVGLPNRNFESAWIDLDALLPLALLYAQRAEGRKSTDELVTRVDELTNMLFVGKMRAIEAADYQRIRRFHMTLGAMFAAQGHWGDGPRGALYQLENMRKMTAKANETSNARLTDPPELLEKLATGYQINHEPEMARRVAAETVVAYKRVGRPKDAARLAGQFKAVAVPP